MKDLEEVHPEQFRDLGIARTSDREWHGTTVYIPWFTLDDGRRFYLKSDPHGREQLAWLQGRDLTNTVQVVRLAPGSGPLVAGRCRRQIGFDRVRARLDPGAVLVGLRCGRQWAAACPVDDWWEAMVRHLVFSVWLRDYDRRAANELNPAVAPLLQAVDAALARRPAPLPDLWQLLPEERPPPVTFDRGGSPQEPVWVSEAHFLRLSRCIRYNVNVVTANLLRPEHRPQVQGAAALFAARCTAELADAVACLRAPDRVRDLYRARLQETAADLAGQVERAAAALQAPAIRAAAGPRGPRWVW